MFLNLNQNICCGYSKEPSQWDGSFEHPKQMLKLMDKKILTILRHNFLYIWRPAVIHLYSRHTLINNSFHLLLYILWTIPRPLIKSVYQKIMFSFFNQNICCGYTKEASVLQGRWVVTWFLLGYTVRKNVRLLSTMIF